MFSRLVRQTSSQETARVYSYNPGARMGCPIRGLEVINTNTTLLLECFEHKRINIVYRRQRRRTLKTNGGCCVWSVTARKQREKPAGRCWERVHSEIQPPHRHRWRHVHPSPPRTETQVMLAMPACSVETSSPMHTDTLHTLNGLRWCWQCLHAQWRQAVLCTQTHYILSMDSGDAGNACMLSGDKQSYAHRSEERRVGKECRSRWSPYH